MTSFSLILVCNWILEKLMNAVNPIEPLESIDFQGQNQLIVSFCSSKRCS